MTESVATLNEESEPAVLDQDLISALLAKNEKGEMTQQDFFRVFLMSVQNGLSTNHRLSAIEKKLEDAESRIEKIEITGETASLTTEPEKTVDEPIPITEDANETNNDVSEEVAEEADITTLVEKAEKFNQRTSRKRTKASGIEKKSARAKRARI